jgi:hypothetical protein
MLADIAMRVSVWKITVLFMIGYAAATCAGALSVLLWTRNIETVGLGLLVPMCAVPSLLGYVLALTWSRLWRWRRVVYVGLIIPWLAGLLWVVVFPSPGATADGADGMALICLVILLSAGTIGGAALETWQLTSRWRRTAAPLFRSTPGGNS